MSAKAKMPKMRVYREWLCPECAAAQDYRKGQRPPRCVNYKWHKVEPAAQTGAGR